MHNKCRYCLLTESQNFPKEETQERNCLFQWTSTKMIESVSFCYWGEMMAFRGQSGLGGTQPSPAQRRAARWPRVWNNLSYTQVGENSLYKYWNLEPNCFTLRHKFGVLIYTDFSRNATITWKEERWCFVLVGILSRCVYNFKKSVYWWQHHQKNWYCQKTQLSTFVAAAFMVILCISASNWLLCLLL